MKKLLISLALFIMFTSCDAQFFWSHTKPAVTIKYGLLYNWYAVTDIRNISSVGWDVPTQSDYAALATYLGGASVAGGKLKEIGTIYWSVPNAGATNESLFNARGNGDRTDGGLYGSLNVNSYLWSSTSYSASLKSLFRIDYNNTSVTQAYTSPNYGMGVRLVYTGVGTPTSYTGNDGKIYRIVTIGTQIWLADNLAETKYRNGDLIPEVTDNSAWTALVTGALCAYNNTWANAY